MCKKETCLWGCFEMSEDGDCEDCPHYYDATESEYLDTAYIENMRETFNKEWLVYLKGWN